MHIEIDVRTLYEFQGMAVPEKLPPLTDLETMVREQFLRALKSGGIFILNIKEKAEKGERHTYVLELILALRKQVGKK